MSSRKETDKTEEEQEEEEQEEEDEEEEEVLIEEVGEEGPSGGCCGGWCGGGLTMNAGDDAAGDNDSETDEIWTDAALHLKHKTEDPEQFKDPWVRKVCPRAALCLAWAVTGGPSVCLSLGREAASCNDDTLGLVWAYPILELRTGWRQNSGLTQSAHCLGAHRALCPRCAKSRLFSTAGSHGSQGPEFCTPDAVLNGSRTLLYGERQGCARDKHRNNWRCARADRKRPP